MMIATNNWLTRLSAWLCGTAVSLWAGLPTTVHVLIYLMIADVLTGLCRAAYAGQINSNCSFRGMFKKAAMLVLVGLAVALDAKLGASLSLGAAVASGFAAVEAISILENARALGLPMPAQFEQMFTNSRKTSPRRKRGEEDKDG